MPSLIRIIFFPTRLTFHITQKTFSLLIRLLFHSPLHTMSGILDALFQRFGGMDYSSHAAQSIDQPATHQIEDADSSSIEPATVEKKRVHQDTPHPGSKVSFSSNSRQSSLRAQSIFPQSPPLEAVDGGAVQVHPSLPPPSPLDLASPPRTDRIVSDTSYTSVSVNTSSDFSTPAELIFPPQSLPFVLRRRAVTTAVDFTPSKAQDNTLIAHLRRTSLNPVIVQDYSEGEDDDVDIQVPENPAHQHQIVGDERVASVSVKLSSWREEQIKYTKRARRGPDTAPKPIPTLHGPLSLPYARNPR